MKKSAAVAASVFLVSACGGSSPGVNGRAVNKDGSLNAEMDRRCAELARAGATVAFAASETCPDCTATNEHQAIDGADTTFASLTAPVVSTGELTLRAAAPDGVTFPAGSNAALTLSVSQGEGYYIGDGTSVNSSSQQDWHVTIRTYLDGALQDEDAGFISVDSDSENVRHIVGTTATLPFDSIEAIFDRPPAPENTMDNVSGSADYAQPGDVQVHEFCSDFDLSGLDVDEN